MNYNISLSLLAAWRLFPGEGSLGAIPGSSSW